MFDEDNYINNKMAWRKKARLNVCIAQDLANSFGGKKADYLKRLNRKLRIKIAVDCALNAKPLALAA
jgi:hypothetical protein